MSSWRSLGKLESRAARISVFLVAVFMTGRASLATVVACAELQTENVRVYYCMNHGRFEFNTMLHYSALARILSDYIDVLAANEQEKKKLEIWVTDPNLNGHILSVGEYQIDTSVALSPRLLARSIHYFALDGRQKFSGGVLKEGRHGRYVDWVPEPLEKYNAVLDLEVGDIDLSFLNGRRIVFYELDQLKLIYQDGVLFYELHGVRLAAAVVDLVPIKAAGRYILQAGNVIQVYENGEVIAKKQIPSSLVNPLCAIVRGDQVEFLDGLQRFLLAYSSKENVFVDKEYTVHSLRGKALEPYLGCGDSIFSITGFEYVGSE